MGLDPRIVCTYEGVHCKYCWPKSGFGKTKQFYCSAFQYCCKDSCCNNINEFYKLWYFWLCLFVLLLSMLIALYWLRNRVSSELPRSRSRYTRSGRRYRQLTGESNTSIPPLVIPDSVITAPPPYLSNDNRGCPHLGPPPYTLGSGSSVNSQTLPRSPPSYSAIVKLPPPSYDVVVISNMEDLRKLSANTNIGENVGVCDESSSSGDKMTQPANNNIGNNGNAGDQPSCCDGKMTQPAEDKHLTCNTTGATDQRKQLSNTSTRNTSMCCAVSDMVDHKTTEAAICGENNTKTSPKSNDTVPKASAKCDDKTLADASEKSDDGTVPNASETVDFEDECYNTDSES